MRLIRTGKSNVAGPSDCIGVAREDDDLPVGHPHVPDLDGPVHAARGDDAVIVLAPVH